MLPKIETLLEKEFDNIDKSLVHSDERLATAQEWLEYLLSLEEYTDDKTVNEKVNKLKTLHGNIAIARLRVKVFKEKVFKILNRKFKQKSK